MAVWWCVTSVSWVSLSDFVPVDGGVEIDFSQLAAPGVRGCVGSLGLFLGRVVVDFLCCLRLREVGGWLFSESRLYLWFLQLAVWIIWLR